MVLFFWGFSGREEKEVWEGGRWEVGGKVMKRAQITFRAQPGYIVSIQTHIGGVLHSPTTFVEEKFKIVHGCGMGGKPEAEGPRAARGGMGGFRVYRLRVGQSAGAIVRIKQVIEKKRKNYILIKKNGKETAVRPTARLGNRRQGSFGDRSGKILPPDTIVNASVARCACVFILFGIL